MATEMERLIVALEARTKAFESQLKKANALARKELKELQKRFDDTNKKLVIKQPKMAAGGMGGGFGISRGAGLAAGAGVAANEVRKYADAWTEAGNKIAAASAVGGRQARSLEALNVIAGKTRSGLSETVDLYAKLLRSTRDVAKSEEEVALATEIVNKSFKAGGAAASEQAAGILQLSQALGSGVLQGDELRSIRENAPLLAQAIAKEFNTTVAGLKELGAEGKLTTDRIFGAILKAGPSIDTAFARTKATIGDGFTALSNSAIEAVGKLNDVSGAGLAVNDKLAQTAAIIENLSSALIAIAGSPAGKFLGFLSDAVAKLEPINRAMAILADNQLMSEIGNSIMPQRQADLGELDSMFKRLRRASAAGVISPQTMQELDEFREKLLAGKLGTIEAAEELKRLTDGKPELEKLPKLFEPLVDNLKEVVSEAKKAAAAVETLVKLSDDERGAFMVERQGAKAYTKFTSDQTAAASRSDFENDVAAKAKELIAAADKLGIALSESAAKIQATKLIGLERSAKVLDSGVSSYVDQVVGAESGGKKNAKNPLSSATGLGQFIETTWLAMFKKEFPDRAANMSREAILALRTDGEVSRKLIEAYARENAAILQSAGVSVDAAALHLAHFLGPQGAVKVLTAAAGTPIAGLLDKGAISANQSILGGGATVDTVRAYAERRAGQSTTRTGALDLQDKSNESLADAQRRIDLITAETTAMAGLNPLINDYGFAAAKAREMQELLNFAQENGIEVTPALRAQYEQLATGLATAEAAGNRLAESQDYLNQKLAESSAFGKDVLGGFIQDLRDGKSATEALAGALDKVVDKLVDVALNSLFDGFGAGAKPGGGILGGLFSFLGFASGGYTGAGGRNQPAGIVHKGEYVMSKAATSRIGVNNLERLHNGGSIPTSGSTPASQPVAINVNVDGANGDDHIVKLVRQGVQMGISQYDKQLDRGFAGKMARTQARQL